MFEAKTHRYLAPAGNSFSIANYRTTSAEDVDEKSLKKQLRKCIEQFSERQRQLYAQDRHSLLLVFQAMDAAGKDSTIRAVLRGINPAGCQVFSFKQPSAEELDHDFLWRTSRCLPERGRIGVFNRSYYEEVLVVRVHPEYLVHQKLPAHHDLDELWRNRFASIREHEEHLARNGTIVLKFWLNISKQEQARRFAARLSTPEKHWKFSEKDVTERSHWDHYMQSYEEAIRETSRPWAPWYVIPADDKPYMRATVADIIVRSLDQLDPKYPTIKPEAKRSFAALRKKLDSGKV